MEETNIDVIEQIKTAIADIIDYQKHLAEEITSIKTDLMDNLINPIKDEYAKYQHDEALSDFRTKYADKLDKFNDKLKIIEQNPDFDIIEKAFDGYNEREDDMDEAEYVDKLADHIQEQLNELAGAFGVEPEKIEEVKVETEDGEVEAKVEDGKVVEVEKEETSEEKETEETTEAKEDSDETTDSDEELSDETTDSDEELSDEEENAKHMAELEEEKKREGID